MVSSLTLGVTHSRGGRGAGGRRVCLQPRRRRRRREGAAPPSCPPWQSGSLWGADWMGSHLRHSTEIQESWHGLRGRELKF